MDRDSTIDDTRADMHAQLRTVLERRSVAALSDVGPTPEELALILRAGTTVPDHGQLRPYRFVVVEGDARARFGDALAAAAKEERPDLAPGLLDKVRKKAFAAPMQIVLVASPREGMKIPEWEQVASASCTGYAITLAAHALGLGAIWKSANALGGGELRTLFGMTTGERILGWVNVGRVATTAILEPREAVDLAKVASVLETSGLRPFSG